MAIAGEPNKIVAYALGIAESTASEHLRSAMRKLGVSGRMELIELGVALGVWDRGQDAWVPAESPPPTSTDADT